MAQANISVIGSMVVDHIMITDRLPDRGETVSANSYSQALGGKGGNSAIAAHRSCHRKPTVGEEGATGSDSDQFDIHVHLIGAIGNDEAGNLYKKVLHDNGLDTSGIRVSDRHPTGNAFVIVEEDSRDNWLLGVWGASKNFSPEDFARVEDLGSDGRPDLVVGQLEIGMKTMEQVLETAGRAEIDILLNASPASHILSEKYRFITHFLVNETEAAIYSGMDPDDVQEENWHEIAKGFLADGVKNVVVTLGAHGAFYANERTSGHVPAFNVDVTDVTGAGDTFTGTYASENVRQKKMQEDWDIEKAVIRACKASALTIQTVGAQESIPWANEIDDFVANSVVPTIVVPGTTFQEGLEP